MQTQIAVLGGAFLSSLLLTPLYRKLALRIGLVDRPDPTRKLHQHEVAISGGVAVFFSLLLVALVGVLVNPLMFSGLTTKPWPVIGLLVSSLCIVTLGVIDDKFALRGRQKLFGQLIASTILVLSGFQMNTIDFFGTPLSLGLFAIPFSIGWILFTINALNLIDGADGLCSSIGWVASAGIAAMALISNHPLESVVASGLSGALLGFLVYNFPPAKIFLGDAGSMLVGLLLGGLALRCAIKGATAPSLLVPVTILAIPIFDSIMAILRRKLTGRSIFAVDRGHLHHNLLKKGFSNRSLVFTVTLLSVTVAVGAFLGLLWRNDWIAVGSMILALGGLVIGRLFGHSELKLLGTRAYHFGGSLIFPRSTTDELIVQQRVRLQGNRSWERIWESFIEFAQDNDVARICMDLNVPWLHEGFHASWQRNQLPDFQERWTTKLPIVASGRIFGRLEVIGDANSSKVFSTLALLSELLESIQPDILQLTSEAPFASNYSEEGAYSFHSNVTTPATPF